MTIGKSAHEGVKKITPTKKPKGHWLHVLSYHLMRLPVRIFMFFRCGFRSSPYPRLRAPYLLVANHATDYDMLAAGCRAPTQLYFVSGEQVVRMKGVGKALSLFFAPIVRYKGSNAAGTVIEILRRIRSGCSVCLFPEGNTTYSGLTVRAAEPTGLLVKKAKCTLVTYRIEGGYLTSPRWGHCVRRGKMHGTVVGVYPPERLATMSSGEICDLIYRDTFVDAYALQADNPVKYTARGKNAGIEAEGIENVITLCPACRRIGKVTGKGRSFSCECGLSGKIDEYGYISGTGFDFRTLTEWDAWQEREFASAAAAAIDAKTEDDVGASACSDTPAELVGITTDHREEPVTAGQMLGDLSGFTVGERRFDFSQISDMAMCGRGTIVFSLTDGGYYEIRGVPGRKYYMLYRAARRRD